MKSLDMEKMPYAWVDLVTRNVNNTALATMSTLTPWTLIYLMLET